MFDFLRLQVLMGEISEQELKQFVSRWITQEQYEAILKEYFFKQGNQN